MKRYTISVISLVLVFSLVLTQPVNAEVSQTFAAEKGVSSFYLGDDNSAIYVFRNKKLIRWVAEHPDSGYSHIFWGKIRENQIKGKWWSISKYSAQSHGTLEASLKQDGSIQIKNESGGLPFEALRPRVLNEAFQIQLPDPKEPEWETASPSLTGAFKIKKKNVTCYSRQRGKSVRMFCESASSGHKKPTYAYLILGEKKNNKIMGKVYGLPKGKQTGSDNITLYIRDNEKLITDSQFDTGGDTLKRIHPDYRDKINKYLKNIKNNPGNVLNISEKEKSLSQKKATKTVSENEYSCKVEDWDYSKNITDQTVINDIDLFPGQLIFIDKNFVQGNPVSVTGVDKSSREITFTDLGGFRNKKESFSINPPNLANYEKGKNNRLAWWRSNANIEMHPKLADKSSEFSWTRKQFLMDIGVNYYGPSVSASADVSHGKTEEGYSFNAFAKYKFYKLKTDLPKTPAEWFKAGTSLKDVQSTIKNKSIGYVSEVTIGSIVLLSFKFDSKNSFTDVQAAAKVITGGGVVGTDMKTRISKAVQNVKIKYLVSGGKFKDIEHSNNIDDIIDRYNNVTNDITTKSGPHDGVPISYKVKYLNNNKLAKIGLATVYKTQKCEPPEPDYISVEAGGNLQFAAQLRGADNTVLGDVKLKRGQRRSMAIPKDAIKPLSVKFQVRSSAKILSSKGGWNFYKKFTPTPGCHYRMGGKSYKKADLVIQECDDAN